MSENIYTHKNKRDKKRKGNRKERDQIENLSEKEKENVKQENK